MTTPHTFADDFAEAVARFGLEESDREDFRKRWNMNRHLAGDAQGIETLAGMTRTFRSAPPPEGVSAPAAPSGRPSPPASLDEEGRKLYAKIEARADEPQSDFYAAMAEVTGVPDYADLGPRLTSGQELEALAQNADPGSRSTDQAARVLMRSQAISYFDAAQVFELTRQLGEAKAETVASEAPWLDTRPRRGDERPVPWSTDDWERDQRRARQAEIAVTYEEWQGMAEQGRDYVGEQAEENRRQRVAALEQELASTLKASQELEAGKRAEAIERELRRRADERLQKAQRRGRSPGSEPTR